MMRHGGLGSKCSLCVNLASDHVSLSAVSNRAGMSPKLSNSCQSNILQSVWIHGLSREKLLFQPEKIYGTLSDILAVEMTKCTLVTDWQLLTSNYMLNAAVAVASNNALKCYRQRLEHQSGKFLLGLSSSLWCCIVAFPLLVSYFDDCTSRCNALHATQKQMNKYIMNVISASSATYQHQAKCRA